MATYGDNDSYDDFISANTNAANAFSDSTIGVNGFVFDLFQADISLNVDPSYAAALEGGTGFIGVDAVAVFDMSAEVFNKLFFITVDSSDIDNTPSNDIKFSIDSSNFKYPFVVDDGAGNDVSMSFSNSAVVNGAVNNQYVDQSLKKDVVRHIAKSVTGGYAVADIFSNESELLADVSDQDELIHSTLHNAIDNLTSASYSSDQINATNITDADELRFFQIAQALFAINLNDSTSGRQGDIYEDLSNNSVDGNGDPLASVTVPLRFAVGDAIALRIQYDPNSSPVGGDANASMGTNPIPSRSYKILIPLS